MFWNKKKETPLTEPWLVRKFGPTTAAILMFTFEVLQIIIIATAIVVPVRYFLIHPFVVKGASMEPNFYDHEYLIIDEISYRLDEPERGDIIVF